MRISDWSSDVCSSDLLSADGQGADQRIATTGPIDRLQAADFRTNQRRFPLQRPIDGEPIGGPEQRRGRGQRSEEHTSELQSLMRISYAVFCLKKKNKRKKLQYKQLVHSTTRRTNDESLNTSLKHTYI